MDRFQRAAVDGPKSDRLLVPRAALIDLDGTLVDSAPELAAAVDAMLIAMELPPAGEAAARERVGGGIGVLVEQSLYAALAREPTAGERATAREHFNRSYDARAGRDCPVYPGVFDGLALLRIAGLRLACVTNKARRFTDPMLTRLGLNGYLDAVVAGDDTDHLKPDPAPLERAAELLGVNLADCIMIGDSAIDVAAARAAGCPVWCLRSGYGSSEPIDSANPDATFGRFDDLAQTLTQNP